MSKPVANDLPEPFALLAACALPCSDRTAAHLPGLLVWLHKTLAVTGLP